MSGIAAVVGSAGASTRSVLAQRLAAGMPDRGSVLLAARETPDASLAVAVHPWQEELSGGSTGRCGDTTVVADATLYYRAALVRSLERAGVRPNSQSSGDLIAAAVTCWGDEAPHHLEGDFAYVAFRATTREGHAARDPVGTRPLFYSATRGGVAVASSPNALVEAGLASGSLDLDWLADLCTGSVHDGSGTSFRDVRALRQGERVRFSPGRPSRVDRWYVPPTFTEYGASPASFDDAAAELRALLMDAVRERLDPARTSFVSLSGGRDSSAVYATGRQLAGDRVRSVSLSYPPGDAGREDETILEIITQCGGVPAWISTTSEPVLAHLRLPDTRPDAFRHPYEGTSRAIAHDVAARDGRVILNGLGGDTLFHAELSYLSDLVVTGRWREFMREWRGMGGRLEPRLLFRWAVLPSLGPASRDFLAALRGGNPIQDVWEPEVPAWMAGGSAARARMRGRAWREPSRMFALGAAADRERRLMLLGPFAGRIVPEYSRISLQQGLEQRSPLYDGRIIRFAASRPRSERQSRGDHKRLLRGAMEGLLPQSVTGSRNAPTGFAGSYFRRGVRAELPQLVAGFGPVLRSADLGLVLAQEYRAEVDRFAREGSHGSVAALVFTALTEHWLRQLP